MEITVKFKVKADVDGWAKAQGVSSAVALTEVLAFVREHMGSTLNGQTFLSVDEPIQAYLDLGVFQV